MRQEQALIWQIRPTSHLLLLTTATADEQEAAAGDNDTREAAAAADDTSRLRRGSCFVHLAALCRLAQLLALPQL